jgi:ribonuclease VapC
MKRILFDSHAILRFYQDEVGADAVEKYLMSAQQGKVESYISEINLGEIYYLTIRRFGLAPAKIQLEQFFELPIQVVAPASDIILTAAEIKAEHAISYADCFAVASALKLGASIMTGDPELKKVEHLVQVMWI